MATLAASSLNGVKIYNLSSGKTLPQWLAEKGNSRKALAKDDDYRRRIELLQDFQFKAGSQQVRMSSDRNYVVTTGVYPPSVKVFDVRDLSLKFERGLDAEVVRLEVLSADFGKLAFLQADRSVAFHAPYGMHYNMRIPKFGRDMTYHRENCELYVAASDTDVYRINLDQGRFMAPLELQSQSSAANVVQLNPIHQLLGVGCENGIVEMFDSRSQQRVGSLDIAAYCASNVDKHLDVTALHFDSDGLTFGVGTSIGKCLLYDLRSSRPLLEKSHQYGLPIVNLQFHDFARKIISSDAKVIKIWDRQTGAAFTSVETPAEVKDVCIVEGGHGKSGVLLVAGEQERLMSYYIPELGIAPKWCSFLDSLTEELEEEAQATVYDDYRFVTRTDIASFGLDHLVGTPLLKAYMHGFFMDARLYNKVKAVAEPFAYEEWRKKKLNEKVQAKQANRIAIQRRLPKINRATAERILNNEAKRKKHYKKDEEADADQSLSNPLNDERFSRMFTSSDFEVDEESDTYRKLHPNATNTRQQRIQTEDMDSDAETDEEIDDEMGGRFARVDDENEIEEIEGQPSDESSDEEEGLQERVSKRDVSNRKRKSALNMYEVAKGEKVGNLMAFGSSSDRAAQREKKQLAKIPLAERMKMQRLTEKERSAFKKEETISGGYVREMSFVPQADRRKQQRARQRISGDSHDALETSRTQPFSSIILSAKMLQRVLARQNVEERRRALFDLSGITTHRQFILRPLWDVAHAVDLSIREAEKLMTQVSARLAPASRSAFDLFLESANNPTFLRTGLASIDQSLNGGLHCKTLSEFAGDAAIGKTQVAMTLAVVCALDYPNKEVMFFDVEHNFSVKRLLQIAIARIKMTHAGQELDLNEVAATVTKRIRVVRISSIAAYFSKFKKMKAAMCLHKVKLLIIDCVTTLFVKADDFTYAQRQHHMLRLARDLKLFADTHQAFVVVTNRATTVEGGAGLYTKPQLDDTWAHCVNTRFIMERHSLYRAIAVVKSSVASHVVQPFTVKECGVESLKFETSQQPEFDELTIHGDIPSDLATVAQSVVDAECTLRTTHQRNAEDQDVTKVVYQDENYELLSFARKTKTSSFEIVSDSNSEHDDESLCWKTVMEE
ncbi:nucleolar protein [Plasmopara halstedii]|uniref:Nucleolar protein n=1 Tax=Plasmopara halstedii TaxID=4781 RepID=A0A0P1AUQ7_PLAHL|nr:nucleolar protein [Plasmopara halstedii]CEG45694.1 nucleolar protein [Plasmopara halstedii]|eukprot:XP_024582063.1 nucleolar protein [Plasmopara halstedii]